MKGKIIVIDGVDASGKESQTLKLYNRLSQENYNVRKVSFPNYDSQSSTLLKMYLNGDFGKDPNDVNSYAASTFFAIDRYASYKTDWGEFYENGGIILCDRYTTSNMVHQAAKLHNYEEKDKFLDWLWDLEYNLYNLPVPDCVFFLDMPPKFAQKLMQERANKFTGKQQKDIHESNQEYLIDSYNNAFYVANKYKWTKINCIEDDRIKTIDEIHNDIYAECKKSLQV
jgi:dTMP kinase